MPIQQRCLPYATSIKRQRYLSRYLTRYAKAAQANSAHAEEADWVNAFIDDVVCGILDALTLTVGYDEAWYRYARDWEFERPKPVSVHGGRAIDPEDR